VGTGICVGWPELYKDGVYTVFSAGKLPDLRPIYMCVRVCEWVGCFWLRNFSCGLTAGDDRCIMCIAVMVPSPAQNRAYTAYELLVLNVHLLHDHQLTTHTTRSSRL